MQKNKFYCESGLKKQSKRFQISSNNLNCGVKIKAGALKICNQMLAVNNSEEKIIIRLRIRGLHNIDTHITVKL
jgi:hypothetical protein